jgi:outer membrane protein assembly factor BamD (BamD/ComL family)
MKKQVTILMVGSFLLMVLMPVAAYVALVSFKTEPAKQTTEKPPEVLERKLAFTNDPDRILALATSSEGKGDWKEAAKLYSLLSHNVSNYDNRKGYAEYRIALCYYNLQDYARAKDQLEYALNNFPDMPQVDSALFLMAKIYCKVGDFAKAEKTYNTIIRMFSFRADEAKILKAKLPQNLRGTQQQIPQQAPQPSTP